MNSDVPLNMLDMGDLALTLLPDTMVRSTEIWTYRLLKDNVQEITAKQAKEIRTAYENLLEYNKDHPEIKPGYKAPSAPQAGR